MNSPRISLKRESNKRCVPVTLNSFGRSNETGGRGCPANVTSLFTIMLFMSYYGLESNLESKAEFCILVLCAQD